MKKTIFNIFILATIFGCVYLGVWQLDRMEWKEAIIEQVAMQKAKNPEEFSIKTHNQKEDLYKKVFMSGAYLHDQEILLSAKYFSADRKKKEIGYHVITPFLTTENIIIFLNRGWIPEKFKEQESRPDSLYQTNGDTIIEGLVRENQGQAPWYMPQNTPSKDQWFWIDLPEMQKRLAEKTGKDNIKQVLIQQTNLTTTNGFEYPVTISTDFEFYNQHAMYVLTWFSLAFIILIMWIIYLRKQD